MMGMQPQPQNSLFYVGINIDDRVRENHPLRRVREHIDFNFVSSEVKDCYGNNGNGYSARITWHPRRFALCANSGNDVLDIMRKASRCAKSKRDIKTRQHLMQRSFARATRYGFDRARWRGLWRMRIQKYLTCAIQNLQVLINHFARPKKSVTIRASARKGGSIRVIPSRYIPTRPCGRNNKQ